MAEKAPIQLGLNPLLNPFGFQSDIPLPGETASSQRLLTQFALRGNKGLPAGFDATLARSPGALLFPGPIPPEGYRTADGKVIQGEVLADGTIQGTVTFADGTSAQGRFTRTGDGFNIQESQQQLIGAQQAQADQLAADQRFQAGEAELARQRELLFQSLAEGAGIFRGDLGNQAKDQLSMQLGGKDKPFTRAVKDRLFSQAADASGSAEQSEIARIRQFFANRGQTGGGGELQALVDAGRTRSASNRQARNQIQITAALENFQARERARQAAAQLLAQQAAAEAPFRLKEADARSRFEVVGDSPFTDAQGALGQQQGIPAPAQQFGGGAFNPVLAAFGKTSVGNGLRGTATGTTERPQGSGGTFGIQGGGASAAGGGLISFQSPQQQAIERQQAQQRLLQQRQQQAQQQLSQSFGLDLFSNAPSNAPRLVTSEAPNPLAGSNLNPDYFRLQQARARGENVSFGSPTGRLF